MSRKYDTTLRKLLVGETVAIYRQVLSEPDRPSSIPGICKVVSTRPASRFYLNRRYALEYASARAKGLVPDVKRDHHRALLEAFYDVLSMELMNPSRYDDMKLVVAKALRHPAPSLGLSPRTIQQIIRRSLHSKKK